MTEPLATGHGEQKEAERAFLDASIEVWREIDRLSAEPGGYQGIDASTELRQRERAAWITYRNLLDQGDDLPWDYPEFDSQGG